MGCLKLSYYQQEGALEVNHLFLSKGLEKNVSTEKKRLSSSTYGFNGYEKDDEIKGVGNSYDFGDRLYDPRCACWLSIDRFAQSYPGWSPYSYALRNPIIFRDKGGNWIVGSDGKAVFYSVKDGQVKWSSNATADVKNIGNAMIKTKTGRGALDRFIGMPTKIKLKLVERTLAGGKHGVTKPKGGLTKEGFYKQSKVVISTAKTGDRFDEVSEDEQINAVSTHEEGHHQPQQIKREEQFIEGSPDFEFHPLKQELKTRREFKEQFPEQAVPGDIEGPYKRFLGETLYNKLIINLGPGQQTPPAKEKENNDDEDKQ